MCMTDPDTQHMLDPNLFPHSYQSKSLFIIDNHDHNPDLNL